MLDKKNYRKTLIAACDALSEKDKQQAAFQAMKLLVNSELFLKSTHIAAYLATSHEIDCKFIIEAIWQHHKNCYIPVINNQNKTLSFHLYTKQSPLKPNKFGILEPVNSITFKTNKLHLVIMPLLGFDLQGQRLGRGAGFYDKTFAFLNKPQQNQPLLLGLGYTIQCISTLPIDSWDIKLNGMLTEKSLIIF